MKRRANNEGTIYWCNTHERWVGQIKLPNGKRKAKYSKNQKVVKDWLLEQRKAIQAKNWVDNETITVAEYMNRYMEDVGLHTLRPNTVKAYDSIIRIHINREIGNIRLSALRPEQLQTFYSLMRKQGLSPRMVQFVHSVIHKALNQAVKWGLVYRNVSDLVEKPSAKRKSPDTWSAEQVKTFLRQVEESRLYPLYVLAATTGMREGELLGLYWEDVNFETSTISVRRTLLSLKGEGLVMAEPKSESSKRSVFVPAFALEILLRDKGKGLIFKTHSGKPISPRNLVRDFKKELNAAGLPNIRFHDLRHTAATLMLSEGIHPKVVQEVLGHSQISLTLDTYSHVLPSMQGEVAAKMDKLLSPT